MSSSWTLAVVSDDPAWTQRVCAALHARGVDPVTLSELRLGPERPPRLALLLDAQLEPHGGAELGAELRDVLKDACPPLLLATSDPSTMTEEQRDAFGGVLPRSADPVRLVAEGLRILSRPRRRMSGVVSHTDVDADVSGTGTEE